MKKKDTKLQHHQNEKNYKTILSILLIEDNESDAYLTKKAFQSHALSVSLLVLHDGIEALKFLHDPQQLDSRPDVILLNINLPKVHGIDILDTLKQDTVLSHIPVIMLTGSISKHDVRACFQKQASGYICKHFDFDQFENSIYNFTQYWGETVILPNR